MSNSQISLLDDILLHENAYIFTRERKEFISKSRIEDVFRAAKDDRKGFLYPALYQEVGKPGSKANLDYRISSLIIRYQNTPAFLNRPIRNWFEQKVAYLFIIDFKGILFVVKRNISGIQTFLSELQPLDYGLITKLFYDTDALLEKISMDNLNFSNKAMRSRSVESDSLADSFNYAGANTYMINHLRINTVDSRRISVSANTSRIGQSGDKDSLNGLLSWCTDVIAKISGFMDADNFLNVFANPIDFETERNSLIPISVTLLFNRLLDDYDKGLITHAKYYNDNFQFQPYDIQSRLKGLSKSLLLTADQEPYQYSVEPIGDDLFDTIKIKLAAKSIRISSNVLRRIHLYKDMESSGTLADYINNKNEFIVNFDQCDLVYGNRKLFQDSQLLGSIPYFLDVFEGDPQMNNIVCEKGNPTHVSVRFDADSAFSYAEERFEHSEYLVLDDLGNEWADHISINGNEVCFIHSKCNDTIFSATAFTDIVGQAQKNIGNIFAVDQSIQKKKDKWEKNYELNNADTQIQRLRKGQSVDNLIESYIRAKKAAIPKRSICLIVNFISKTTLTTYLNNLENGVQFAQRKEAIQILWLLSSLIGSCRDYSVDLRIVCKP
ncbi:hypothetical protein [Mucilaginibacter lacusdianchii]|uniref:hypothetical protein n=1 Tax=Mucilaginibacter lacusdianchii TaxID=2684211 RepID=UPI00131B3FE4|nr:hypothetical protein [Mucilaginibacter sp. JXJ CY 39]